MSSLPGPDPTFLDRLGVSANLRSLIARKAAEFEANLRWADYDTFAYESVDADSSFDLNEIFHMPQVLGGAWNAEELSLTGLGLFESRSAPITCKTMFDLVMVSVERKKRLRDDATVGSVVLATEYSWPAVSIERAHEVIRLVPGLIGNGQESDAGWSFNIFRGALLEYRLVTSPDDLWSVLQGQALQRLPAGQADDDLPGGSSPTRVAQTAEAAEAASDLLDHPWRPKHVRVFLSHIHQPAAFAQEVCESLRDFQIDGFVAHTSITPSRAWQDEIEQALNTADVLVGLLHPGFSQSIWSQQEVGWALGRKIPTLMVHLGEDPQGFQGRFQASPSDPTSSSMTARRIMVWLATLAPFGPDIAHRLLDSLANANSYVQARDAAVRLDEIGNLSPQILDGIREAYVANNQIAGHIAEPIIERIMQRHGRQLPSGPSF